MLGDKNRPSKRIVATLGASCLTVESVGELALLMAEIRLTTWDAWNPVDNGIFTIWTG